MQGYIAAAFVSAQHKQTTPHMLIGFGCLHRRAHTALSSNVLNHRSLSAEYTARWVLLHTFTNSIVTSPPIITLYLTVHIIFNFQNDSPNCGKINLDVFGERSNASMSKNTDTVSCFGLKLRDVAISVNWRRYSIHNCAHVLAPVDYHIHDL